MGISQANQKLIEIPNSKEFDFSGKRGEPQVSPYKILMDLFESLINYFNQVFLINLFKKAMYWRYTHFGFLINPDKNYRICLFYTKVDVHVQTLEIYSQF